MKKNKYQEVQSRLKRYVDSAPTKLLKIIRWLCYFVALPWIWFFYNIRDWRTIIIFIPIVLIMSSEVWIPGILGLIYKNNSFIDMSLYCLVSFWLSPGNTLLVLSIVATMGVKTLWNKITERKTS